MPNGAKRKLSALGCCLIELQPDERLSEPIASHPDMILFYRSGTLISSCSYCERYPFVFEDISRLAPSVKLIFTEDRIEKDYPRDAVYNALAADSFIFVNPKTVSGEILKYAKENALTVIETKQGYPACTAVALSGGHAVTADRGMIKAFCRAGIKAYEIQCGYVSLPPYGYGFIGGACGVLEDKLLFIGDPKTHPSYSIIKSAAEAAGLTPTALCEGELLDLGRIIFIDCDIEYNS